MSEESKLFTELPKSFLNPYEYDAEYVLIPGGRYKYQGEIEKEVSNVYFAKYPVTNRLYRRFICYLEGKERELLEILPKSEFDRRMIEFASDIGFGKYHGCRPNSWPDKLRSEQDSDESFNGDDQPVVGVSWFEARAYCFWLCAVEESGRDSASSGVCALYRLPTEIKWEWAASGGKREYPWPLYPREPDEELAKTIERLMMFVRLSNYDNNVGATTPVGCYPEGKTPEGLMDMAGNVWEWMENLYGEEKKKRSLRGGGWYYDEHALRCSFRLWYTSYDRGDELGFRVVRSK